MLRLEGKVALRLLRRFSLAWTSELRSSGSRRLIRYQETFPGLVPKVPTIPVAPTMTSCVWRRSGSLIANSIVKSSVARKSIYARSSTIRDEPSNKRAVTAPKANPPTCAK
jgi:hypothetical protein